mmetsp:Transcript_39736/g.88981  ORF Transcript_39736/g.88981 Transcript_39736/m.88981 type:complete len:229 (-) Transcript_39736:265-951(-)
MAVQLETQMGWPMMAIEQMEQQRQWVMQLLVKEQELQLRQQHLYEELQKGKQPASSSTSVAHPQDSAPEKDQKTGKRKICQFYAMGACPHGDACKMLHTEEPDAVDDAAEAATDDQRHEGGSGLCKYYAYGKCARAERCSLKHQVPESFPVPEFTKQAAATAAAAVAQAAASEIPSTYRAVAAQSNQLSAAFNVPAAFLPRAMMAAATAMSAVTTPVVADVGEGVFPN